MSLNIGIKTKAKKWNTEVKPLLNLGQKEVLVSLRNFWYVL